MLPFKRKQEASVVVPEETKMRKPDDEESFDPLNAAAQELINSVHSKNIKSVAEALRAAFMILELEPHAEGEHIESEEI